MPVSEASVLTLWSINKKSNMSVYLEINKTEFKNIQQPNIKTNVKIDVQITQQNNINGKT